MNLRGLLLLMALCFVICFACGCIVTFWLLQRAKTSEVKRKKHSFKTPVPFDLKETININEEYLYDKTIKESVDGSNASKEFKKG